MDGNRIRDIVSGVVKRVYDYLEYMQFATDPPMGTSEVAVIGSQVSDDYAVLSLENRLGETSGLMLKVGPEILDESSSGFTRYDDISKTIVVRPGERVLGMISEGHKVSVLSDMKFIVTSILEFYKSYGHLICMPSRPMDDLDPIFPEGNPPTVQQARAARGLMNDRMAYVWGAPGTGKTQFVLSSCIRGCLDAGERVAVIAPTNNSVEQVLRGIIKTFPKRGSNNRVVRLGVPTRTFLEEYPDMCEDRQAQRRLESCMDSIDNLEEVLYERSCDSIRNRITALRSVGDVHDLSALNEGQLRTLDAIEAVCEMRVHTSGIIDVRTKGLIHSLDEVESLLFDRPRPALSIVEYRGMKDSELVSKIQELEREAEGLRFRTTGNRIQDASIVAMTPHQFISRFRPRGSEEDGRMELDVDRIFLDEAGYCGLVQALTLFSNGVPVIMLGDHMQLPPVSELDEDMVRDAAQRGGSMEGTYLWMMSALHCETMLSMDLCYLRQAFLDNLEPVFDITGRYDLTESHRFASNLAEVLDEYVYKNGMTGNEGSELEIECIDVLCERRDERENTEEVKAIVGFLRQEVPDPESVCILSPYRKQVSLLRSNVPKRYRDSVMTVHGSQGREWDTIILSVADNRVESRDVPYRFTSSKTAIGRRVINTAVSRAKKRLILVCDRRFWQEREDELIGGLILACDDRSRSVPSDEYEESGDGLLEFRNLSLEVADTGF